jgi:hypothetical protein
VTSNAVFSPGQRLVAALRVEDRRAFLLRSESRNQSCVKLGLEYFHGKKRKLDIVSPES